MHAACTILIEETYFFPTVGDETLFYNMQEYDFAQNNKMWDRRVP